MSKARSIYHFSSTVLYNEVFDPRDDLIVSLVRTNEESGNLGAIQLEGDNVGGDLLGIESGTGSLNYNFSNEFENLCLYIFDSKVKFPDLVPSVRGATRSTAVSSFDVGPKAENIFLSAGKRFIKNEDRAGNPGLGIPYWNSATVWVSEDATSQFRFVYNDTYFGKPWGGWEFRYNNTSQADQDTCFYTTASATSGLFPWELTDWYISKSTSNTTLSTLTGSTVKLSFSGFTSNSGIAVSNNGYDLDGPGAGIVTDLTEPVSQAGAYGMMLSGALVLACVDNNGAFSLSGSQKGFYTGGTESLSSKVFSVRALSALQSTDAAALSTYDFKGAVKPADEYSTVDEDWKLLRVGFKRNLQDVVFYTRENGIYETQQVFETGFNLEHLPPGIKIGLSYSGHMPMEIQNLTVNGILTSQS